MIRTFVLLLLGFWGLALLATAQQNPPADASSAAKRAAVAGNYREGSKHCVGWSINFLTNQLDYTTKASF
jgi:hypothetical protein